MLTGRQLQIALKAAGFYQGKIDGDFGPISQAGADKALRSIGVNTNGWLMSRRRIAWEQWAIKHDGIDVGLVDGFIGPATRHAYEQWQDQQRDIDAPIEAVAHIKRVWPRQKDMQAFYGKPGSGHILLDLPYPMRLAWDKKTIISRITIHGKCAASAGTALSKALDYYGHDRIKSLGLDLFGGSYSNRAMRGGKSLSTHAYAAAIDINPEANQLRWGRDRAAMAHRDCAAFLNAFEEEGWISLGRERNFDWMHLQAARL